MRGIGGNILYLVDKFSDDVNTKATAHILAEILGHIGRWNTEGIKRRARIDNLYRKCIGMGINLHTEHTRAIELIRVPHKVRAGFIDSNNDLVRPFFCKPTLPGLRFNKAANLYELGSSARYADAGICLFAHHTIRLFETLKGLLLHCPGYRITWEIPTNQKR